MAKWLRRRSAKSLFSGSNPDAASNFPRSLACEDLPNQRFASLVESSLPIGLKFGRLVADRC